MKKEIFTKEEIKEMEQMQERAKAKRLQEERIMTKKKVTKKIRLKNNIIKMMLSLTFNAFCVGGIMRALDLENGLMLLFMICALLFNNLLLSVND